MIDDPGPAYSSVAHHLCIMLTPPAYIFLTVDDVTSTGVRVMVGDGSSPPVQDQGVPI